MPHKPIHIFSRVRPIPEGYQDDCIEMVNGRLRITQEGHESLGRTAKRLGIDLQQIKCFDEYLLARQKMAPYFFERLAERLEGKPDTLEYQALRAIVARDDEKVEEIVEKLRRIQAIGMRVIKGDDH